MTPQRLVGGEPAAAGLMAKIHSVVTLVMTTLLLTVRQTVVLGGCVWAVLRCDIRAGGST